MKSRRINLNFEGTEEKNQIITRTSHRNFFALQRQIMKLPPSAKFILFLLKLKGPLNRKKIIGQTLMPDRTVGFAIKKLVEHGLIQKQDPNFQLRSQPQRGRRRRRQDRRITNYYLTSPLSSMELVEAY